MASVQGDRAKGYRVFWREGGKQRTSPVFRSKLDATDYLRDVEERLGAVKQARMPALGSTPLEDLFKRHRASRLSRRRARGAFLDEKWQHIKAMADEQEWKTLRDITAASVDDWCAKRPNGRGTDKPVVCLKSFLVWCRRVLKLPIDHGVMDLEKPRTSKRPAPDLLTEQQVERILLEAQGHGPAVLAAMEHLAFYACRPIDICRARVKDWNPATRTLTFRDTKNTDDLPHVVLEDHAKLIDALAEGRDPDAPLFLDPWGREWRMSRVDESGAVIDLGKAEGMASWYKTNIGEVLGPCRKPTKTKTGGSVLADNQRGIYQLKRYAMTRLIVAAKGDRKAVAALSGHRTLSVVDRYLQANRGTQEALIHAVALTVRAIGPSGAPDRQSTSAVPALPTPSESLLSSVPIVPDLSAVPHTSGVRESR